MNKVSDRSTQMSYFSHFTKTEQNENKNKGGKVQMQ